MNPSATVYIPSSALAQTLNRRQPTPPAKPPMKTGAAGLNAIAPAVSNNGVQLTAAERLRSTKNAPTTAAAATAVIQPLLKSPATSSKKSSAAQTPVLTQTRAPHVPATSMSPSCSSCAMATASTAASISEAKCSGFVCYTKQELLSLRPAALGFITRGPIVDHPPFLKIPESFANLLELPHALEYVDVDAATRLVEHRSYASPLLSSSAVEQAEEATVHCRGRSTDDDDDITHARLFHCAVCAAGGSVPCPALRRVIHRASKLAMSTKLGAVLMQPALVVESLLRLALVFEAKQSSIRLRMLAERSPGVVHLVEEYLCGEGYHLPLPPVTAHAEWAVMNAMLKFDAIRDNKTRVITDLSKHWRKRRTQFEQFVHFFAFRDARPVRPVKNIITQSVKPGMVAMLMGDVTAVLLLHRLGFFIPPDYYWSVYPFLRQALGEGTLVYDVVRHLGLYFSSVQPVNMYNPVERPAHAA